MAYELAHIVVSLYDPKKSIPESNNHWLCKLVWKSNEKTGRVAHASRCLSIPMWTPKLSGEDASFVDILIESVQELQQKAAHAYVTTLLEAGKDATTIPSDIIKPATILAAWQEEQDTNDTSRGKLKGSEVKDWFRTHISATLQEAFAQKKGWLVDNYQLTPDDEKKLEQVANGYAAMFEKLASPIPDLKMEHLESMKTTVALVPSERADFDPIYRKVVAKLTKLTQKKDDTISIDELL